MGDKTNLRWRFAGMHSLFSILVAICSAILVFGFWYEAPYRSILGVSKIYILLLLVDVVCGPLLTFILANPKKSCRELSVDLSIIIIIQLFALSYGMYAMWHARPVVLAFEKDRLVVLTANQLSKDELARAPEGLRTLPLVGVIKVGTRDAHTDEERAELVEQAMRGISTANLPKWWVPYSQTVDSMRVAAKPLAELMKRSSPTVQAILEEAALRSKLSVADLYYLPLTSANELDWIVLLDHSMGIVAYAPVDGF